MTNIYEDTGPRIAFSNFICSQLAELLNLQAMAKSPKWSTVHVWLGILILTLTTRLYIPTMILSIGILILRAGLR